MNVVQLSDTHFGTEEPAVVKALLKCLSAMDIDLIIVSGDITQRAGNQQFRKAKAFFERLPTRQLLMIPGNHDIPLFNLLARLFWPFHSYQSHLSCELQPVYRCEQLWLVGLNTVQRLKHVNGRVSVEQVDWVSRYLKAAPEQALKVVVAHHPFAIVLPDDVGNLIGGAAHALNEWSRAGLDLVLGGHIHFPFVAPLSKHFADIQGDPWVVQAGTAVSRRVRNNMPNSFVHLQLGQKRTELAIQRWDYNSVRRCFIQAHRVMPWSQAGNISATCNA